MSVHFGEVWSPSPFALLRNSVRVVRQTGGRMLVLVVATQLLLGSLAFPLVSWLFREALRANGMMVLDMADFGIRPGIPLTIGLILTIIGLLFFLVVLQFAAILTLLKHPDISISQIWQDLVKVARKVFRASSIPVALYALLVIPLAGFGFTSVLLENISIPAFITGELAKESITQVAMWVFFAVIMWLNIRLALTIPCFALTSLSGTESIKRSWHLTRGFRSLPFLFAVVIVLCVSAVCAIAAAFVSILPTALADALWDDGSVVVAAFSLGLAQVTVAIIGGFTLAVVAGVLMGYLENKEDLITLPNRETMAGKRSRWIAAGATAVAVVAMGFAAIPTMEHLSRHPDSIIMGHRGFTAHAVENTIDSLEAAHAAGADIVELDAMQTKDGGYIVMHDTSLGRLASRNVDVKDITFDEAVGLEIHDRSGNTGQIPSLIDFGMRAKELGQPLLIEIKLSGAEGPDHVAELVSLLEDHDLLEGNIFHSLDAASVTALKQQRPDLTVGYIMPFAAGGVPNTLGDFLVIEESSAGTTLQRQVTDAGLGFVVWTPNQDNTIRERLRRDTDAIITDRTDLGIASRSEMADEKGLSAVLYDALVDLLLNS